MCANFAFLILYTLCPLMNGKGPGWFSDRMTLLNSSYLREWAGKAWRLSLERKVTGGSQAGLWRSGCFSFRRSLPFPCSPPPESNQRISLQVWKQQQLELKAFSPFSSHLNAGSRDVSGSLDPPLERTSNYEGRLEPAHPGGGRDGSEGADRAFAQTMGGPLPESESVSCLRG